ncbi:cupin domain-containing protein [Lysobacter sp. D1-1-M9]|uniref:cupin domain-containing protein n=1 Tax=Novilysobacter longmucuonensis TaxID=3098603 RepID=UPI002FCC88E9
MRTSLISTAVLALLGSAAASAQSPQPEPALVWTAQDPALQWGPCPDFLPSGCAIAVLHGDPASDNADVFLKLPPDSSIPAHWHTSAERMVLVSGELHVTYDGHDTAVLRPGSYAYGPAKLPHTGRCAKGRACVLFIAFESPVDAIAVEVEEPVE